MAVAIAAATAWSAGAHPAPASGAQVAAPPAPSGSSITGTSPAAASSSAPSSAAAAASATRAAEAQAQAQLQAAQLNAELTGLAQQLPAAVRLTAPAAWKTWTGARPLSAHDVDGCPHLADRLGTALGGRWRYAQGTLPAGPDGCSWTSTAADGLVVGVGYEHGSLPGAPTSAVPCDRTASVPVPTVRPGALLLGCDGATGRTLTLALPDTGGTGVFLLHAGGGPAGTDTRASDALRAVLAAARHAYAG